MAGGVYGADIGQLRALAAQLERSADEIESAGRLLTQGITTTTQWQGPDATGFRGEWSGTHHPRISSAAAALREGARSLRANADQQESTSAVDGGSAGPTVVRSADRGAVAPGSPSQDGVTPYGLRELLDQPFLGVTAGVPLTWEQVIGFIPDIRGVPIGDIVTGVTLGEDLLDPSLSGWEKVGVVTLTGADVVGGVLRGTGDPIAYGAGVAISTWVDVFEAAQEADFSSSGVQMVFDEITRDPWGSAVAASEAVVGSLGDLVDNFTWW